MSSIYDQLGDACKQFGKRVGMAIKEANDLMATNGRREREMSKYVIELDEDVKILQSISVTQHGNAYTNTKWVANLEELNSDYINENFGELQDEAYQAGLNDAWEAAKKIFGHEIDGGLDIDELKKAFGDDIYCTADIIRTNTAEQAIAKLKAYEEKQKADDEINVGDEVRSKRGWTAVVVKIDDGGLMLMDSSGVVGSYSDISKFSKTGKHYDIQSILEAMRNDR